MTIGVDGTPRRVSKEGAYAALRLIFFTSVSNPFERKERDAARKREQRTFQFAYARIVVSENRFAIEGLAVHEKKHNPDKMPVNDWMALDHKCKPDRTYMQIQQHEFANPTIDFVSREIVGLANSRNNLPAGVGNFTRFRTDFRKSTWRPPPSCANHGQRR